MLLRKAQLHSAALDAYILLEINKKLQSLPKTLIRFPIDDNAYEFNSSEEYANYYENPLKTRFLVDSMCWKVAKSLRNLEFDAAFLSEKDYDKLYYLAKREKRVIITRDSAYFRKMNGIPCLLLKDETSSIQLKNVLSYFGLKENRNILLSRCLKCNHNTLKMLSPVEAKLKLHDAYGDYYSHKKLWECLQCKNIFASGETSKKSQLKLRTLMTGKNAKEDLK